MPTKEIEELKQQFVDQLFPVRIYQVGSYADNSYTDSSDLDFYIIVRDNVSDIPAEIAKAYKAIRQVKQHPVDIVIEKESRFNARKNLHSIENETFCRGVFLYDAESERVA